MSEINLESDTKLQYIGKTRDYVITSVSSVRGVDGQRTVSVGDEIEGLRIGAIRCSFHWRDASYGGEPYMWRGRWACQAGRTRYEVENAVRDDGQKLFAYLHAAPIRLAKPGNAN